MVAFAQPQPPASTRTSKNAHPGFHVHISGLRYYNPETGRWVRRDSAGERAGANTLAFAANSPLAGVDPLGLEFCYSGGIVSSPPPGSESGVHGHTSFPDISFELWVQYPQHCEEEPRCTAVKLAKIEVAGTWWALSQSDAAHELLHVADMEEIAHDQLRAYLESSWDACNISSVSWCIKAALDSHAGDTFAFLAAMTTVASVDLAAWPDSPEYTEQYNEYHQQFEMHKAQLQADLAACQ